MFKPMEYYYKYKRTVEKKPIFARYQKLLEKKGDDPYREHDFNAVAQTSTMQSYFFALKVIEMYENVYGRDFDARYAEFCEMKLFDVGLMELNNAEFSDGICVRHWCDAIFRSYLDTELEDSVYEKVKNIYLASHIYKDPISYDIKNLLFAMKLDSFAVAELLDVKEYVVGNLINDSSKLTDKMCHKLIVRLEGLSLTLDDERVRKAAGSLLMNLKKFKAGHKNKVQVQDNFDFKDFVVRAEELKMFVTELELSSVGNDILFSDGRHVSNWWNKVNMMINSKSENSDLLIDYVSDIKIALFDNEEHFLNEKSIYDYGRVLYKVIVSFGYNSEKILFEALRIPSSLVKMLFKNKIYPSETMLVLINDFLCKLQPNNIKQSQYLREALDIYKLVGSEIKNVQPDNKAIFGIYNLDDIEKYEREMDIDSETMKKVKEQNLDWYYKCVTYNYVVNVIGDGSCSSSLYFYDGSVMMKWIQTQKRILENKPDTDWNFTPWQEKMAKYVLCIRRELKIKEDIGTVVTRYFDEYMKILNNHFDEGKTKLEHEKVHGFWLEDVWSFLNNELHNKNTLLSESQIKEYKLIKRKYLDLIRSSKKMLQNFVVVDFGTELVYLLDSLGWTFDDFSEQMTCSRSNLYVYSANMTRPSEDMIELFIKRFDEIDKSQFRNDQIEDIKHFIEKLKLVPEERVERRKFMSKHSILNDKIVQSVIYGDTRDVYDDVPSSCLLIVEKEDAKWFDNFIRLVDELNDFDKLKQGVKLSAYKDAWFLKAVQSMIREKLSYEKKVLIGYLVNLTKKNFLYVDYAEFIDKCSILEEYLINNRCLPVLHVDKYEDGTEMRNYFLSLRDVYYGYEEDRFKYFDAEAYERIKGVAQLAHVITRKKSRQDEIVDDKMYLGVRLSLVRISLGMSKPMFAEFIGIDEKDLNPIYSNREAFSEEFILLLNNKLSNLDFVSMREDQVRDVSEFLNIIANRKIEGVSLTKRINEIME